MAFDPISWALGFGATQVARNLLNKLFSKDLRESLAAVGDEWSCNLPHVIATPASALLESDELGPEREKLQIRLYLHNQVPDESLWFGALFEAWKERKRALSGGSNEFFQQDEASAGGHLKNLAKALALACTKERELFQVSALTHLEKIASDTANIENKIDSTTSSILNQIKEINLPKPRAINRNYICQLLENPHICHGQGLMELNSLLLIDAPSSKIAGRIRKHKSWVGAEGGTLEQARYVPPGPDNLPATVANFVGKWSDSPTPFKSSNTSEICFAMAQFHHELVSIHPFEDGNGRVARVLTEYQAKHLLFFKGAFQLKHDGAYLAALALADDGNCDDFASLLEEKVQLAAEESDQRIQGGD